MKYTIIIDTSQNEMLDKIYDVLKLSPQTIYRLETQLKHCTGCFQCWIRHIGECVINDQVRDISRSVVNSDKFVMISPILFGSYSVLMKRFFDRFIPNVLPFIKFSEHGPVHTRRYHNFPEMIVIGYIDKPKKKNVDTFRHLVESNARNLGLSKPIVEICSSEEEIRNTLLRLGVNYEKK